MTDKLAKLIFLGSAVACTALRVYLKLTSISPKTGFYEGGGMAVPVFNWIFGIAIVALIALGLSQRRNSAILPFGFPSRIMAILTGAGILWFSAESIAAQLSNLSLSGSPFFGVLVNLILVLVGLVAAPLLSGLVFLYIGAMGKDGHFPRVSGWLMLAPLVWQVGLLLSSFMSYTAVRSVSDQMLFLMVLILSVPFQLAHARLVAEVNFSRGARQLMAFGLPFSVAAISVSAGIIASVFSGKAVRMIPGLPAGCFLLFMGLYAATLCFSLKTKS